MTRVRTAILATSCAVAAVSTLSAQRGAPPESQRVRHLVYIATPGDNGTDNQSGVVVLDADKGYSFIKRIPYDLPAFQDARAKGVRHHGESSTPDALRHR
ncbi:MAG: hypothetical protein ABMA15_11730 [Vicinamibacterales bacterium]